jgi:hypothetical protein
LGGSAALHHRGRRIKRRAVGRITPHRVEAFKLGVKRSYARLRISEDESVGLAWHAGEKDKLK